MLSSEKIQKIREMVTDDADLWNVLTATRGPDDEDDKAKRATTGVIRWKPIGPTAGVPHYSRSHDYQRNFLGSLFGPDCEEFVKTRKDMRYSHFYFHVEKAFLALGLKWDEVNK